MSQSILFLDFDGVLNSANWFQKSRRSGEIIVLENGMDGMVDPDAVANLNRIIEATGCKVVISSTWRRGNTLGSLLRILVRRGLDKRHWDNFIGMTPVLDKERGHEIQAWMDKHLEKFGHIVILDDDGDMAHLMPHLVLTHGIVGLDEEKTADTISRLTNH